MSSDFQSQPAPPPPPARTPVWVLLVVIFGVGGFLLFFCGGIMVALTLPAIQAAREAARRSMCSNNMQQIGMALHNYHEQYRAFPPAYVSDANGKPMHSWRVLILPFLGDPAADRIYEQYDFTEPWDGPNNSKLAGEMLHVFHCPSSADESPATHYVAVVGPDTAWPGETSTRISDIRDGLSNTILLVETADAGIHWMEPKDLTIDQALQGIDPELAHPSLSSNHTQGINVLFCDGSLHFLRAELPPGPLNAYLTRAGGESIGPSY